VQSVLAETKALALFYLKPNGEQRAANLTKVIDAARSYEVKADATFGGFVRWLDERTKAAEEAESPLAAEGDGFVKLMTVHQAKGLEFPVVVLPDLCGGLRRGIQFVVDRGGRTFDAQVGARDRGVRTLGFGDATDREQRVQEAEERRVLYVAATRARDRLIVPHFPKKGKPAAYLRYLTGLSDDAAAAAGCAQREVVETPDSVTASEPKAFRADLSQTPPKACEKLCKDRDKWMADRKKLIEKSSAGKRLRTASALGDDYQDFGSAAGESETGKAVGTAVHAVLEQADLKTADGLAALAASAAEQQNIPEHAPLVEELVRNALQTDLVMRAANARKLYREVPFAVNIHGSVLEGLIDLAFDDGSGLEIVDYKTDDVPEDHLAEHAQNYRLQVGAYALAAKEVFGAAPRSASLLFLRTGKDVPIEVDDALLEAVTEKL
jgi:ATP-dependent helicase/nuclease subunit A